MRCVISRTQHACLYCVQCGHLWRLLEEERATLAIYQVRAFRLEQMSSMDWMERFYNHISQLSLRGGVAFSVLDAARQTDCAENGGR